MDRHLVLRQVTVPAGVEWTPPSFGWVLAMLENGIAYWTGRISARELVRGDLVVLAPGAQGLIRASQLGPVELRFFGVQPELLGGILTGPERNHLRAAAEGGVAARFVPAEDPLAQRFAGLCHDGGVASLTFRCRLLQLWAEIFSPELDLHTTTSAQNMEAKERFRQLMHRTPEAGLRDFPMDELARALRCSPRHLARLFRKEIGVSFRARRAELRVSEACQLIKDVIETWEQEQTQEQTQEQVEASGPHSPDPAGARHPLLRAQRKGVRKSVGP